MPISFQKPSLNGPSAPTPAAASKRKVPKGLLILGIFVVLFIIGSVSGKSNDSAKPSALSQVPIGQVGAVVTSVTLPDPAVVDPTTIQGVPSASWVMPDMTGQVLQNAQDEMQALTGNPIFFTGSSDAKGTGRMQVLDSNWHVCSQTPLPGARFDETTDINFASVKLSEDCP